MATSKTKNNILRAAHESDIYVSPKFRETKNLAFEESDGDGEVYSTWRSNTQEHIGALAANLLRNKNPDELFWESQRQIALSETDGKPVGPFADYFFAYKQNGRFAEVEPSDTQDWHLPAGELDIVRTNSGIVRLRDENDDPIEFLANTIDYMRTRRAKGGSKFEGPENYATALKFFVDKLAEQPLESQKDKLASKKMANEMIGNFLRISDKDEPNVVEITNILASIKHLPDGTINTRYTPQLLHHVLTTMPDFSQKTITVLMGALNKLDISECGNAAAMTTDLAIRKGARFERSGDMLSVLRVVAKLPLSPASERAFTSFLDVRNALEISSDIPSLAETNKLLLKIVQSSTENIEDTKRAKFMAEFVARKAVTLYKSLEVNPSLPIDELEKNHRIVSGIIQTAKQI
jgi:hypothetical protein